MIDEPETVSDDQAELDDAIDAYAQAVDAFLDHVRKTGERK